MAAAELAQRCPDESTVLAFVERRLSADRARSLEIHVDGCSECRAVLAVFARSAGSLPTLPRDVLDASGPTLPARGADPSAQTMPARLGDAASAPTQPARRSDEALELPVGAVIGRYRITRRLGAGGMGVVYGGHDPELDRKVALKLLHPGTGGASEARARLVREAQAMARLSHPNVVTVYDVGSVGDQAFVAMELVEGTTLRGWMQARRRSWRETVAMFIATGRGLAAAHEAGLVHRDFKPENVLLDGNDTPRVTDFGLARLAVGGQAPSLDAPLTVTLTVTGSWVGTPAYMAPEQYQGEATGAFTDQFSFCVSLWEALYGERPFAGKTVHALCEAVTSGAIRPPPPRARVPAWLHRIVTRGLAVAPADRFPSLDALLAELSHDRGRRRRRALVAAVVPVAAIATFFAIRADDESRCTDGNERVAAFWNASSRDAIRAVFVRTGLPYGDASWRVVDAAVDARARAWTVAHKQTCEATHVRGEQSGELLELRMSCLRARLEETRAYVTILRAADREAVASAAIAVHDLRPLEDCADLSSLTSIVKPPRTSYAAIDRIQTVLAEARALHAANQHAKALAVAEPALADVRALGYRPLEAEALLLRSALEAKAGSYPAAERTLREALRAAEAGQHDREKARIWIALADVVGSHLGRPDAALQHANNAAAVLERVHDQDLEGRLAISVGMALDAKGDHAGALASFQNAVEILTRVHGAEHPLVVASKRRVDDVRGRAQHSNTSQ